MSPAEQVVDNLLRIRNTRRLTWREISEALAAEGCPIPQLGLRRAVTGQRRLDVNEVAVLAQVLGVSPWWRLASQVVEVQVEVL